MDTESIVANIVSGGFYATDEVMLRKMGQVYVLCHMEENRVTDLLRVEELELAKYVEKFN